MGIFVILVATAVLTADTASTRKDSPLKSISDTPALPTASPSKKIAPQPADNLSVLASKAIHLSAHADNFDVSKTTALAQGRKSLKQRKPSGKKRSPNHALLTKFGLSRWEGEEARRGAAYTDEAWRSEDHHYAGDEAYPRIPIKVKKGGGSKRRSSDEAESDMYYVRLPPNHHYYSPFLHGHPDAAEEPVMQYDVAATERKHHDRIPAASARTGDVPAGHSQVINIQPLPPSHSQFDHTPSASHYSQHRHHAVRRLPLSFRSNGKPGPVYHWNLPILRGDEEGKRGWKKVYGVKSGESAVSDLHSIPHKSHPKSKPLEEQSRPSEYTTSTSTSTSTTTEFPYIESDVFHVVKTVRGRVHPMAVPPLRSRLQNGHHRKPYHRKPLSSHPATAFPVTTYYTRKGVKSDSSAEMASKDQQQQQQQTADQKSFFQGNGKPHGFYVINGNKKFYHRLLP